MTTTTTSIVPYHKSKDSELKERKRILAPLQNYLLSTVRGIEQFLAQVKITKIETNDTFQEAGRTLRFIKTARMKLVDTRLNITRPMQDAKDEVMKLFQAADQNLKKKEDALVLSMNDYKKAVEAERQRQEAALLAEQLAIQKKEAAKKEREAKKLEAAGKEDEAALIRDAIQDDARVLPAVNLPRPKAEGIYEKVVWDYEIVNAALIPREWLMPDEAKIGKQVRGVGDTVQIPGIRIFKVTQTVTRKIKEEVIVDAEEEASKA